MYLDLKNNCPNVEVSKNKLKNLNYSKFKFKIKNKNTYIMVFDHQILNDINFEQNYVRYIIRHLFN